MCSNKFSPVINPSSLHFSPSYAGSNHMPVNFLAFKNIQQSKLPLANQPYGSLDNTYGLNNAATPPNPILLTPAVFGGLAAFTLGFGFHGHSLAGGYNKFIFFINIYSIIATFGVGYYIYQLVHWETGDTRFADIIFPVLSITVYYAAVYNLIYSLYPFTFTGTIGDTPITQFLSFLSRSIGSISVGETFDITMKTAGVQILTAIEVVFNFFVITLLMALLV